MHHSGPNAPRRFLGKAAGPMLLLSITVGFYWKLVLTDQYTWLESPDLAYQVLPWLQFQASEWHAGRFPLWDPYMWAGQPLLAQALPGAAYPLNWLLFVLPLGDGWIRLGYLHWYFVLIHWMGAVFMYALCRDLGRSRTASVMAGTVFALGGWMGTTDWPQMLNGAVWAPLVLLFLFRAFRGLRPRVSAAWAGVFLGTALLGGHHQIPTFTALAAGGVCLFHFLRTGRPNWRAAEAAVLFLCFAALTSGLQALPAYEYGKLAQRWVGMPEPVSWQEPVPYLVHGHYSLHPYSVLGIVLPGVYSHASPYLGVTAFVLALLGIRMLWADIHARILVSVATIGLFFSFGSANIFHGIIYILMPLVEKARTPAMAIFIFHLGITPLIAYGIDQLAAARDSLWLRRLAIAAGVLGLLIYCVPFGLVLARRNVFELDNRIALTGVVALVLAALLFGWRTARMPWLGMAGALLGLMLTELGMESGYNFAHRQDPNRTSYLKPMAQYGDVVKLLRQRERMPRIQVDSQQIRYNFGDWHGIDVLGGYLASITSNMVPSTPVQNV